MVGKGNAAAVRARLAVCGLPRRNGTRGHGARSLLVGAVALYSRNPHYRFIFSAELLAKMRSFLCPAISDGTSSVGIAALSEGTFSWPLIVLPALGGGARSPCRRTTAHAAPLTNRVECLAAVCDELLMEIRNRASALSLKFDLTLPLCGVADDRHTEAKIIAKSLSFAREIHKSCQRIPQHYYLTDDGLLRRHHRSLVPAAGSRRAY
jgi:hypothetical protein